MEHTQVCSRGCGWQSNTTLVTHTHTLLQITTNIDIWGTADYVLDFASMNSKGVDQHSRKQVPELDSEICSTGQHVVSVVRLAVSAGVEQGRDWPMVAQQNAVLWPAYTNNLFSKLVGRKWEGGAYLENTFLAVA